MTLRQRLEHRASYGLGGDTASNRPTVREYGLVFIFLITLTASLSALASGGQSGPSPADRPAGIEGGYRFDAVHKITLSREGRFVEDYLTDKYVPEIAGMQTDGIYLSEKTICRAEGSFHVVGSDVILDYEKDTCGLKEGHLPAHLDSLQA